MGNSRNNRLLLFCARVLLVLAAVLLCCVSVFGTNTAGSIRLTCVGKTDGRSIPLAGDRYALVRIADAAVDETSAAAQYTTCGPFQEYDCDWSGLRASQTRELARKIAETVMKSGEYGYQGTTDRNGVVTFSELPPGLYLLMRVHTEPVNAQFLFEPCFQKVPQTVNGKLVYQIEASPKYEPEKPDLPPKLPQTGQLNWPIPVMLVSGVCCFLAGMEMCYGRRKTEDAE